MTKQMDILELFSAWDKAHQVYSAEWSPEYRCPPSCAACCETSPGVPISPAEAEVMADATRRLAPDRIKAIRRRCAAIVEQIETPTDPSMEDLSERSIGVPRNLRGACPLLFDGRCSVYEARPLICRGYGFTADENGFFMGCEELGGILKRCDVTLLPTWNAAFRLVPEKTVLDARGRELPPQGIIAEMLGRVIGESTQQTRDDRS